MKRSKWALVLMLAALVALGTAAGATRAFGCYDQNPWHLVATPGDSQVSLSWDSLPPTDTVKIVRWTEYWVDDSATGDGDSSGSARVSSVRSACFDPDPNEEPVVVFNAAGQSSFVDTGVVNGQTYFYTMFVHDDSTGEYLDGAGHVNATPGPADTVSPPALSSSYVRRGVRFSASARVSTEHTTDTKARLVLSRKTSTGWVYAASSTRVMPADTTYFKGTIAPPTRGSYKLVVQHIGVGEATASSSPKFFYSH